MLVFTKVAHRIPFWNRDSAPETVLVKEMGRRPIDKMKIHLAHSRARESRQTGRPDRVLLVVVRIL